MPALRRLIQSRFASTAGERAWPSTALTIRQSRLLINSLDCLVVSAVNGQALATTTQAEKLWASLLKNDTQ